MAELKGSCKTCLGCNRLTEEIFEGISFCKNYVRGTRDYEFKEQANKRASRDDLW